MRKSSATPLPINLRLARRRLVRLVIGVATILTLCVAAPIAIRPGQPDRANRAYGPAQRIAEWLQPGRREAPPLIPAAAWEGADELTWSSNPSPPPNRPPFRRMFVNRVWNCSPPRGVSWFERHRRITGEMLWVDLRLPPLDRSPSCLPNMELQIPPLESCLRWFPNETESIDVGIPDLGFTQLDAATRL